MATRSTIAMEQPDGWIMKIYCHWDGYLSNNGQILKEHYQDTAKIYALMLLGDLSSLRPNIGQPHDFEDRTNDTWCTAFGRDRGESDTDCKVYRDFEDYQDRCGFEEYNYLWRHGQWWVQFYDRPWGTLEQAMIAEAVAEDE